MALNWDELVDALQGRLNALVICLSHSWGGLEQVAANDAQDVANQGLQVRVLCMEGSPLHEYLAKQEKIRVLPISYQPRDFLDVRMRGEILRQVAEGVNLIHCHQTSLLGSVIPWLWSEPQVAVVASRHIMNNHNKKGLFHRFIYQRLDALVVMSQTLRSNVLETHAIKESKVKVINLGLDFTRFNPERVDARKQRALWGADAQTVVIGLVGRIDPAKGQTTFIKSAAGLIKNKKPDEKFKFVMVGEETLGRASDHLTELKRLVSKFHLDEHVIFAGYQENIPEVMSAFDIFVMPSRQEAFGLVAIEAMAMQCPIVISSGGSAAEIVGEEDFGLLVRPEDPFDLQRQLREMIDNPKERSEMGRRARKHVLKNYDRKVRVFRTLELYHRSLLRRARF